MSITTEYKNVRQAVSPTIRQPARVYTPPVKVSLVAPGQYQPRLLVPLGHPVSRAQRAVVLAYSHSSSSSPFCALHLRQ